MEVKEYVTLGNIMFVESKEMFGHNLKKRFLVAIIFSLKVKFVNNS